MGTKNLGSGNDNFTASKEGWWIFKKWKSWTIHGNDGNDTLTGGEKSDAIYGDNHNDILFGRSGDDQLYGGNGNDILNGESGNDKLIGGNENDRLIGGSGNDNLTGGLGADQFVLDSVNSRDKIEDFQWEQGDKVIIVNTGFGATSVNQFSYQDSTGSLLYNGTVVADLQPYMGSDFIPSLDIDIVSSFNDIPGLA
jgi:Ca2+-binding RTX toxin-like protein